MTPGDRAFWMLLIFGSVTFCLGYVIGRWRGPL